MTCCQLSKTSATLTVRDLVLQWKEASYTTPVGDIDRVYTVCHVAVTSDTDNWLVMPFFAAQTANRVYIQLRFIMRRCAAFTDSVSRRHCKVGSVLLSLHQLIKIGPTLIINFISPTNGSQT